MSYTRLAGAETNVDTINSCDQLYCKETLGYIGKELITRAEIIKKINDRCKNISDIPINQLRLQGESEISHISGFLYDLKSLILHVDEALALLVNAGCIEKQ
uniref:Uncharacterized protein n=1 Tax=Marseillevirus LCMAC201 TaxID=2506605 RepID=A0A481YYA6_9VIRU|nr:MAG: hypothetical protein LCMAC201_03560 [Marseillevirus LCMAC201]